MAEPFTLTIDGREIQALPGQTVLEACRKNDIFIPTLCHFDGLTEVGACRFCLVEVEGVNKLLPTCVTQVHPNQKVFTPNGETAKVPQDDRGTPFLRAQPHLRHLRGQQQLRASGPGQVGRDGACAFPLPPAQGGDGPFPPRYVIDHNRCVMCTRCVRVCDEVEGAHVWDVMGRGADSRIVSGFHESWTSSTACTWCGKCSMVCPVGAIWPKEASQGKLLRFPQLVSELVEKRNEP